MPDQFQNARAYYDVTFPNSGDSFLNAVANIKNALQGLGSLDAIPLQPRAHNPANTSIMVRGRDASGYYNPIYAGDADKHIFFASGDSPTFSAPASNPRIDIVYLTASGDIRVVTGTEAATPTLPSLAPSGDTRIPICAVYHKVGQAKIVNFEEKDSSTGDGYIYQDLRPWLRMPTSSGTQLGSTNPLAPSGDAQATAGTASTASRLDHRHAGVYALRVPGQTKLQGEIELAGNPASVITQGGNRFTINSPFTKSFTSANQTVGDGTQVIIAHGLGAAPSLVLTKLLCTTGDLGYSAGDVVVVNPGATDSADAGLSVVIDATNITIRFGTNPGGAIGLIRKDDGSYALLTNASWLLIVSAWV